MNEFEKNVMSAENRSKSIPEWNALLAAECGVYAYESVYIARRLESLNCEICALQRAKEIAIDNCYSLMKYKYFPAQTEEDLKYIKRIVSAFTANLKTVCRRIEVSERPEYETACFIPDGCIAFRNGVYDFVTNEWLFKYDIIEVPEQNTRIYQFPSDWIIQWYFDFDFEPWVRCDISAMSLEEFITHMQIKDGYDDLVPFRIAYNMAHSKTNVFNYSRMSHLLQIMGYTLLQEFSPYMVFIAGPETQGGRTSLFKKCFTDFVEPKTTAFRFSEIQRNKYISDSLTNVFQNICFDREKAIPKNFDKIKSVTNSLRHTMNIYNHKFTGYINTKFVFDGFDTRGIPVEDDEIFESRINVFESFFRWDANNKYLNEKSYYDTRYEESEMFGNIENAKAYIYMGVMGIKLATRGFTDDFRFTENDRTREPKPENTKFEKLIYSLRAEQLGALLDGGEQEKEILRQHIFDVDKTAMMSSPVYRNLNSFKDVLTKPSKRDKFFEENGIYISFPLLRKLLMNETPTAFYRKMCNTLNVEMFPRMGANISAVYCTFDRKGFIKYYI